MVKPASKKVLDHVKKVVLQAIFKHLPKDDYCIFLFGSQVSKDPFGGSDFDIGILSKEKIDESKLSVIKDEVGEKAKTLRKIDIIDFAAVDDKVFLKSALRRMKIWHETPRSRTYLSNLKKHFSV